MIQDFLEVTYSFYEEENGNISICLSFCIWSKIILALIAKHDTFTFKGQIKCDYIFFKISAVQHTTVNYLSP